MFEFWARYPASGTLRAWVDANSLPAYFLTRLGAERLGADTVAARPMNNRSRARPSTTAPLYQPSAEASART